MVTSPILNVTTESFTIDAALQGLLDGFLIGGSTGGWILFARESWLRPWFRSVSFLWDLALNSFALLVIFLVARALGSTITSMNPARFFGSMSDPHLLYALPFFVVVAVAVQFMVQMSRIIGGNALLYFVGGAYREPVREERIFLFVDLVGSTKLAEELGSARYYELLRRFVDDLTEPILESRGEIYQYAGDEVVVTWRLDQGAKEGGCVQCFFDMERVIERHRASYEADFGVVPQFRAGLHGGEVVAGELGSIKQSIVFVGDILNTAARLEDYAKQAGERLVVSGALLDQLSGSRGFRRRFLEEVVPRGKQEAVAVYAIDPAEPASTDSSSRRS